MIQSLANVCDLRLGERREIMPLREVLPHQPVGVLVQAPLPTGIRVREVELSGESCGNLLMPGELSAVVRGDGLHLPGQRTQEREARLCDGRCRLVRHLPQERQLGLALNHAEDGSTMPVPDDEIGLPIAHTAFAVHKGGAFVEADAVGQLPPPVILAVAFAPRLAAPQRELERAAPSHVRVDIVVAALVAHVGLSLQFEPPDDLLRTPLLAQERLDPCPGLLRDARLMRRQLARPCQFVGLLGTIAAPAAIAAQLARDSAFVAADDRGNLRLVLSGFHQGVNLVSLLAGKLRVTQSVLPLTWWLKQH